MAGSLNRVTLIGNLGSDPEVRSMGNGDKVANLSVATSDSWTDKATGEKKERTEWHRVVVFGGLTQVIEKYLKKGARVYLAGELRTRKWTDSAGVERYSTEVVVQGFGGEMIMLDSATGNNVAAASAASKPVARKTADIEQDDIPF